MLPTKKAPGRSPPADAFRPVAGGIMGAAVVALAIGGTAVTPATASPSTGAVATPGHAAAHPAPVRFVDPVFRRLSMRTDVRYGRAPLLTTGRMADLRLDLYQPSGDRLRARPALVIVHAGSFAFGDKGDRVEKDLAIDFARRGYVTASINYRLSPTGCLASALADPTCQTAALAAGEDAKAAVRWLRANAGTLRIDRSRVAIAGDSAGGIIATGLGARPEVPGNSGNPGFSNRVRAFMSISGGLPNGLWVGPGDAPGLLFHNRADSVVPYAFSASTAAAMRRSGVPVRLVTLPGDDHVPWDPAHRKLIKAET